MSGEREPVIQCDISVPEEAGGPGLQLTQGGDARLWPRGAPEELEEVEGRTEERRAQPCSLQDGDTRQETFICQPGKQPDGWPTSAPSSPVGPRSSPPPPALPKKSASVSQMTGTRYREARQPGIAQPSDLRRDSLAHNNRHHVSQPQHQHHYPGYNNGPFQKPQALSSQYPTMATGRGTSSNTGSNPHLPGHGPYPPGGQVNPYPHGDEWNNGTSKYLDEMRFASKVSRYLHSPESPSRS